MAALLRPLARAVRRRSGASDEEPRFSQGDEDRVLTNIFRGKPHGYFVDVGAHDGVSFSNTYRLYQRGWRGLCVEPHPEVFERLRANRPGDHLVQAAASNRTGRGSLHLSDDDMAAGLVETPMTGGGTLEVDLVRIAALLDQQGVQPDFDLVSIDAEGTELEVVEGLELGRYRPQVIVLEYNTSGRINQELQPYLGGYGYQVVAVTRWNLIASRRYAEDAILAYRDA